jgi:hypothetical protein
MPRILAVATACLLCPLALAQPVGTRVTTPKEFLGHSIGEDYWLANYKQLSDYWRKVDSESDRVQVVAIGKTEEGRDQLMAIISSPENMRRLEHYRGIAKRLALGDATAAEASALAKEGKAVIWIDGGLHASEVLGAQQLIETVYRLASRTDEETMRIMNDCIVLVVHANPDGMDLVSDWYMRKTNPQERSTGGVPRLYQKYIGHDNNRDFYANTQAETINMNRILYREWFPQIMYNHHQTAPAGTIIFAPPFRGPFNFHVDPLVEVTTAMVGMAMHTRFVGEGKPGAVMRNTASYQTWWNGGLRTTAYFHNMVGILTEAFGSPNPSRINFSANRMVPSTDNPFPIEPQEWKFAQSIEYELTANYAILDYASRYRSQLLSNIYTMARNSIEKGRKDTWTLYPKRVEGARSMAAIKTPANRDAKAYVVPSDQVDFPTAVKFINALINAGVIVHRADSALTIGGKSYPAGSFVVRADQAFRPHVLDMFEPQDYPNDFQYQGGPPIAPYDNAGYTLAYSMGVQLDRILEPVNANLATVSGLAKLPSKPFPVDTGAGYTVDHRGNNAFIAMNRVLKAGGTAVRTVDGFYVPFSGPASDALAKAAFELGVGVTAAGAAPTNGVPVGKARIALWDRYGGSMTSGWTRWLLEQFEFDFDVVYPPDIDAGKLAIYDVLILPSDASFGGRGQVAPEDPTIPAEWRNRMGSLSVERSVPRIKEFLESGKTVIAIGGAGALARHLQLPVTNHLVETVNGQERPLPREKFYVPTSILRMDVNTSNSAAWGMPKQVDVVFDNSPVYRLLPGAEERGITPILSFSGDSPLRSGWAWGQQYLNGGVGAFEAFVGQGRLLVYGPEITFRAQPHGTFKLLFNALYKTSSR